MIFGLICTTSRHFYLQAQPSIKNFHCFCYVVSGFDKVAANVMLCSPVWNFLVLCSILQSCLVPFSPIKSCSVPAQPLQYGLSGLVFHFVASGLRLFSHWRRIPRSERLYNIVLQLSLSVAMIRFICWQIQIE